MAGAQDKSNSSLEWEAPERAYTKRSANYFRNLFAVLAIFTAVAIFFREFALAAVFVAYGFFRWVLDSRPPKMTRYSIREEGLRSHQVDYKWEELEGFWFAQHEGQTILHVETKKAFPGRVFMPLGIYGQERVAAALRAHLPQEKNIKEGWWEKISATLSRWFPLG